MLCFTAIQQDSFDAEGMPMALASTQLRMIANEDGGAILDSKLGMISTLNSTGACIWQALLRGYTPETIAASLAGETGHPLDQVEVDVAAFVNSLKAHGLMPQ